MPGLIEFFGNRREKKPDKNKKELTEAELFQSTQKSVIKVIQDSKLLLIEDPKAKSIISTFNDAIKSASSTEELIDAFGKAYMNEHKKDSGFEKVKGSLLDCHKILSKAHTDLIEIKKRDSKESKSNFEPR